MPASGNVQTLKERVATVLDCVAVDRRLGGVLFVDLSPSGLRELAKWLNIALADGDGTGEVITLTSTESDDDLWCAPVAVVDGRFTVQPTPGPLVDLPADGPPRTIIVPDLSRASRAVIRAAVIRAAADTAVADRHGSHFEWQPRSRWLAACARRDLGRLSRHLLDRFVVRIDAAGLARPGRNPATLRAAFEGGRDAAFTLLDMPPSKVRGKRLSGGRLGMTKPASRQVVATVGDISAATRRDLALARTARALSYLEGNESVQVKHVREAAAVLGLAEPAGSWPATSQAASPIPPPAHSQLGALKPSPEQGAASASTGRPREPRPAAARLKAAAVPAGSFRAPDYPEIDPDSVPEYAALREPWPRRSWRGAQRGPVIGTEPTQGVSDIAFVATLLEAAKFQKIRRERRPDRGSGLLLSPADLRRYQRQPQPDTTVVLVLDHTARRAWDWSAALAPYLRWAYTRRSALIMVDFGHHGAAHELRAETYRAASVLDQRVAASLDRQPGRATPLAHALEIAIGELRRQLRRSAAPDGRVHAWFIVASDGRGNVPLEASLRDRVIAPTGREGVTDARVAAAPLQSLTAVRRIVLAPPDLTYYRGLPFDLADAMGGIVAQREP